MMMMKKYIFILIRCCMLQAAVKENDVKMIIDNDLVSKPEPEVIIDHPFFHSMFHQVGIIINFS